MVGDPDTRAQHAAIDYALELGIVSIWTRTRALADGLRERLSQIDGVTVRDAGAVKSGIVTFTLERCESRDVRQWLATQVRRINVSRSTVQSTMLDTQMRGLRDVVRASVHACNSDEDVGALAQAVQAMSEGMAHAR
ncbi:aminotransferase class V-fold PLP-dependent enzyme [Caballeronia sp. KNU42]